MSEKWTKGPRFVEGVFDDGDPSSTVRIEHRLVALRVGYDANASLISAAPDLAEVAEELIRIDANLTGQQRDDAMSDLIVKARAALAKARGEA